MLMHGARVKQSTIRKPGLFGIIMFAFLFRQCMASETRERWFRARGGGTPVQMRLWNVSAVEVLVVQSEWHSALCVNAKVRGCKCKVRSDTSNFVMVVVAYDFLHRVQF
jgi:hypothetical protein